jgi:DNA-directed RNA polymerase subunit M/transcription elongation factor TFIIS
MDVVFCEKCGLEMEIVEQPHLFAERSEMDVMSDDDDYMSSEGSDSCGGAGMEQLIYECPRCHDRKYIDPI